tara:strand:- start:2931 stop:3452 length:522 start_codon:yes stop_codon:yes gene_type:complete
MGKLLRIGLTCLIVLLLAVAIVVFKGSGVAQLISLGFAVALIIAVWLVKRMGNVQELQSQNSPQAIDRNTKKLIGIINTSFNNQGIDEIGTKTQQTIVETLKGVQTGEFKNIKHAVATLKRVPASKFHEAKDTGYLAATLAAYYILADEEEEIGFNTKTRVDNFIAGIEDDNF